MMHKLFASLTVTGVVCGYAAMLYALIHILVLLNRSYLLSLTM
jgi:hypothetical protein